MVGFKSLLGLFWVSSGSLLKFFWVSSQSFLGLRWDGVRLKFLLIATSYHFLLNLCKFFALELKFAYEGYCCDYLHCENKAEPICDDQGQLHQNLCFFKYAQCLELRKFGRYLGTEMNLMNFFSFFTDFPIHWLFFWLNDSMTQLLTERFSFQIQWTLLFNQNIFCKFLAS